MDQCPWCSGKLIPYRLPITEPNYYECAQCQWIALGTSFYLTPEQQKDRYLQHQNDPNNEGYVRMFEEFITKAVIPFNALGKELLDYGSGPRPVLADLLRQKGYRASTYDRFFDQNEEVLNNSYDGITLTEVLEHLEKPRAVLGHLVGLLRPGGHLSIMTLFHPNDPDRFAQWWYRRDKTHVAFYSNETFLRVAEVLGIRLVHCDGMRTLVFQK